VVEPQNVGTYKPDMALPKGVKKIGSIEIGDTGFTTDCSLTKVVNVAKNEASGMGGHAIKLTSVNDPDLASTCYRIEADVYRYPTFDASEDTEQLNVTENKIKNYLQENKRKLDPIEGIWVFSEELESKYSEERAVNENVYDIAIVKKDFESENEFDVIMISSENEKWDKVGLLKGGIESTAYGNIYDVSWITSNGTSSSTNFNLEERGLLTGQFNTPLYEASVRLIKKYPSLEKEEEGDSKKRVSTGTGFAISNNGLVVTNNHVVSGSKSVSLKFKGKNGEKKNYSAEIIISDEDSDLSILKIEDDNFGGFNNIPYGISEEYSSGQDVFTLGYPMTDVMGESVKVTEGIISSTEGTTKKDIFMQTTVPIQPGNSGGPLFDMRGNIVGITTATLSERATGVDAENVNYSIKSNHFISLASVLSDYSDDSLIMNFQENELSNMVNKYSPYICIVEATIE
jgi:S1-C subfamily serine protease